ncbi:hypothetical protein LPTSP4_14860 [Leptospira ryugenii]|uniref:Uncharacterized protein n=1 Tax=Leptospira ryugenii TaxID=1917863 RepID=A0A2P2DZB8_9LEPT|nr:tetratricopeptide repeat protein [Leptospira ryugenii]GBF49965.1 hypothetical protein LPTSP4_14860 [Leptospira ryugenii]
MPHREEIQRLYNAYESIDHQDLPTRLNTLDQILSLDPKFPHALREKAMILSRMNQKSQAKDLMKEYLKHVNPSFTAGAYFFIAEICHEEKHLQDALQYCNEALHIQKDFEPALELRAEVYEKLGEHKKSEQDLLLLKKLRDEEAAKWADPNHYYHYK